ncbi:MAG: sigma 54-interacting transcriptional regulator, partial [Planctomycetaceae bacterium]|nr:sigma 54-interacting transcriptional regulator [Planctomycetaceae bacterium]
MTIKKKNVVIGLVGLKHDKENSAWRPTIQLVENAKKIDLSIDRFHLLVQKSAQKLARQIKTEIEQISPQTTVILDSVESLAWNYKDVSKHLYDYVKNFTFNYQKENYYVHITTGTETVKNCWILLITNRVLRAKLIQTPNPEGNRTIQPHIVDTNFLRNEIEKWQKIDIEEDISAKNKLKYADILNEIKQIIDGTKDNTDCRFLLLGETGTGKTKLAQDIAEYLNCKDKLVEVNCACLLRERAMSELCGYKKGAFTGA